MTNARVLLTASYPMPDLVASLRDCDVRELALIDVRPVASSSLQVALSRPFHWLVFTSRNAVPPVVAFPQCATGFRVACVGSSTSDVARDHGFFVSLLPQRQTAKGLLEAFSDEDLTGRRVIWPRGNLAPDTLIEGLQALGAEVDAPVVYETTPNAVHAKQCAEAIQNADVDVIAFFSPSAVQSVVGEGCELNRVRVVSIGPTTTMALRDHTDRVFEAPVHDATGVKTAIDEALA